MSEPYRTCQICFNDFPMAEFVQGRPGARQNIRKTCRNCYNEQRRMNVKHLDGKEKLRFRWTVEFDPDDDFTGRQFPPLDIDMMVRLHAFSPGAVLVDPDGRRRMVGAGGLVECG